MNVKILQARIMLTYCEIFAVVILEIQHSSCLTSFPLSKDSFFQCIRGQFTTYKQSSSSLKQTEPRVWIVFISVMRDLSVAHRQKDRRDDTVTETEKDRTGRESKKPKKSIIIWNWIWNIEWGPEMRPYQLAILLKMTNIFRRDKDR